MLVRKGLVLDYWYHEHIFTQYFQYLLQLSLEVLAMPYLEATHLPGPITCPVELNTALQSKGLEEPDSWPRTVSPRRMSNNSRTITLQQAKESRYGPNNQPNTNNQPSRARVSRPNLSNQAKIKASSTTQDEQLDLFRRTCSLAQQIISQTTYDHAEHRLIAMQDEILAVAAALARAQARARRIQQIQLSRARRSHPQPLRAQYAQIEAVPSEYFADVDGNETEDELILEVEGVIL